VLFSPLMPPWTAQAPSATRILVGLAVHGLAPFDDVDVGQDVQQLILEIELVQLAAFAAGEVEDRNAGFVGHHNASCNDLMSG